MDNSNGRQSDASELSPNEELVGQFLEMLDKYGPAHAEVKRLLNEHPELHEWGRIAGDMERDGRKQRRRSLVTGFVFSGVLVVTVILGVMGVYRSLQLPKVEAELAKVKTELTTASDSVANLEITVTKQEKELTLYAHARENIAKVVRERDDAVAAKAQALVEIMAVEKSLAISKAESGDLKLKLAGLSKERDVLSADLAKARDALKTVGKERESALKDLAEMRDALKTQRTEFEEKLQDSPYLQALVLEKCSLYRNVKMPKDFDVFEKLMPRKTSSSFHYASAIWNDYQGKDDAYRRELEFVIGKTKDQWSTLASAELSGLSYNPDPIVNWLVDLEGQLMNPPKETSFAVLLLQREVGQQAALRMHLKTKGKARVLNKLIETMEKGKGNEIHAAISACGAFGYEAKDAVPQLVRFIRDVKQESIIQWEATVALGKIGPAAESAVPELMGLTRAGRDAAAQDAAWQALERITVKGRLPLKKGD